MTYFSRFPRMSYDGVEAVDLTSRVALRRAVTADARAFHPLDVPAGTRADQVAGAYYDQPGREWLVLQSAEVFDPYHDWYLSEPDFRRFLVSKYGSVEEASERVVFWRAGSPGDDREISVAHFESLPEKIKAYYEPDVGERGLPLAYVRREQDLRSTTNRLVTVELDGSGLQLDERVTVRSSIGERIGQAEVAAVLPQSRVVLRHVEGDPITGTRLVGVTTSVDLEVLDVTQSVDVIPIDERAHWYPVTALDWETEKNESRRSVRLIDRRFVSSIEIEIGKALTR